MTATEAPPFGRFCYPHMSWRCQNGNGECQASGDVPQRPVDNPGRLDPLDLPELLHDLMEVTSCEPSPTFPPPSTCVATCPANSKTSPFFNGSTSATSTG